MTRKPPSRPPSPAKPASPQPEAKPEAARPAAKPAAKAADGPMGVLDEFLGSRAPIQIPGKVRFLMAKFGHWLVMALMVLVLPGQLISLGMRAAMLPFASMAGSDSSIRLAFALAMLLFLIVILILALPGLQSRKVAGWQLLMLANGINLVYGLLTGGIVGPILGALIWLYVLFQLRRYYM